MVETLQTWVVRMYLFKTNISCIKCVDRVKPQWDKLEQDKSNERWHLDLNNPEDFLEIGPNKLSPEQVKQIIRETGFAADFTQPPQAC